MVPTAQRQGLEGVVALNSEISSIIDGMLSYRGISIDELAELTSFEEVVFLLWEGRLPVKSELTELRAQLDSHASVPKEILQHLKEYPSNAPSMDVLRTSVSLLSLFDPLANRNTMEANREKAIRLTAKLPTLITAFHRVRKGLSPVAPRAGLGFARNFLYMLTGEEPQEIAVQAFDKALILHADHELNASTFAARVTTATLSDMYSAITTALGTLKGPLHGGANERVMAMLEEIGSIDLVKPIILRKLDNKEKIMGFGHRVYKDGDPRAKHLRNMSYQLSMMNGDPKWYQISERIEQLVLQTKGLKPNVDFYSASVYHYLGIPRELFTPIFAASRIAGWTAHVMEQLADNRLIRPRAKYVGPTNRSVVPIEQRQ
jgi:citrate synthase